MKKFLTILVILTIGYWGYKKLSGGVNSLEKNMKPQEEVMDNSNQGQNPQVPTQQTGNPYNNDPHPTIVTPPPQYQQNELPPPQPYDQATDHPVMETQQSPYANMPGNTLVSCQTKIKFCEPNNNNFNQAEADNTTFCITYLQNCESIETVQRTWTEEEVFPKTPSAPEPMMDNQQPMDYPPQDNFQLPTTNDINQNMNPNYNPNVPNPSYEPQQEIPGEYPNQ